MSAFVNVIVDLFYSLEKIILIPGLMKMFINTVIVACIRECLSGCSLLFLCSILFLSLWLVDHMLLPNHFHTLQPSVVFSREQNWQAVYSWPAFISNHKLTSISQRFTPQFMHLPNFRCDVVRPLNDYNLLLIIVPLSKNGLQLCSLSSFCQMSDAQQASRHFWLLIMDLKITRDAPYKMWCYDGDNHWWATVLSDILI